MDYVTSDADRNYIMRYTDKFKCTLNLPNLKSCGGKTDEVSAAVGRVQQSKNRPAVVRPAIEENSGCKGEGGVIRNRNA